MAGRAVIDDNFRPVIAGVSSADDATVVSLRADPTLKALNVNEVGTSSTDLTAIKTAVETLDNAISGNEMQVDVVSIPTIGHNITGMVDGVTTVTTAGTDVVLAASTACKRVTIQAQTDNTNIIAVGAAGVDATETTGTGFVLYPGDGIEIDIDNLADIYIDSLVDGEGVRWAAFT